LGAIGESLDQLISGVWKLGGLFLVWELRHEICWVLHIIVLGFIRFLQFANCCALWLDRRRVVCYLPWSHSSQLRLPAEQWTEQNSVLTCMAAAGAGGVPYPIGSFLLVSRPPNWDEVWLAGYTPGSMDALARTTSPDGSQWAWVLVKLVALGVKTPIVAADGSRRAPAGVPVASVNWLCTPPESVSQWEPDAVEVASLIPEATDLVSQVAANPGAVTINTAGVGGDFVPLPALGPAPGGAGGPVVPAAPGAVGLGLQGGNPGGGDAMNLKALEEAIQQLQSLALSSKNDAKKDSKKSKKDKKKKSRKSSKKKGKKRSKKSKRSRSSSSSSGSTSRSRSRSSSSSSSSSSNRPLRWKEDGKDKKVTFSDLSHIDQLKLKKKGDLIAFASKHPGALTAHFLASVYARLSKGTLARSAQLREVSVAAWANQFAGLAEIRDMKEVLTLAEILDNINRKEVARALDILVQRILAIQMAKSKGGSWEKSESIELLSSQKGLASSSMLALTNQ
jgi:hypothetical protein